MASIPKIKYKLWQNFTNSVNFDGKAITMNTTVKFIRMKTGDDNKWIFGYLHSKRGQDFTIVKLKDKMDIRNKFWKLILENKEAGILGNRLMERSKETSGFAVTIRKINGKFFKGKESVCIQVATWK